MSPAAMAEKLWEERVEKGMEMEGAVKAKSKLGAGTTCPPEAKRTGAVTVV